MVDEHSLLQILGKCVKTFHELHERNPSLGINVISDKLDEDLYNAYDYLDRDEYKSYLQEIDEEWDEEDGEDDEEDED